MDIRNDLTGILIKLASPEEILSWSKGEVIKPETLNYRTQRPEKDGLFSERIFGPTKDYECYCGKYKKIRYKGVVCEKCGVEVTRSIVRRERMGHITLAAPVSHIWFLRTVPSRLGLLLDTPLSKLEKVMYYASFIVTAVREENRKRAMDNIAKELKNLKADKSPEFESAATRAADLKKALDGLRPGLVLSESEYYALAERFGDVFEADRGAGAVRTILENLDLKAIARQLMKELEVAKDETKTRRLLRRIKVVRSFLKSGVRPEWMVLTVLPILPPDLRPMVALDGGRYATADLNDLYRRVINRNNRLKKLMELRSPEVIITNEKRMLQEAVDALIDNSSRAGTQLLSTRRRPLRSLADILKGKQGRFRQNLLGKRVDYSGRSVIVVGPDLKLNECGLPKTMALELFRHFVINKIIERGLAYNIKQANRFIEQGSPEVWEILEEVIEHKKVLLNRAPTLHRLGIQAFKPVLIEDLAIRIPPSVCSAFNADFDGDQMAVHLPLTLEAQYEASELMSAGKNLLKPANGDPIVSPTQDMVLGLYVLTREIEGAKGEGKIFSDAEDASLAYESGIIDLNAKITVRLPAGQAGMKGERLTTTYGRIVFNRIFPEDFGFVNDHVGKKALSKIVARLIEQYSIANSQEYLDRIKDLGFYYATRSAVTWGMGDTVTPEEKQGFFKEADVQIATIESQWSDGFLTAEERREKIIEVWTEVRNKVAKLMPKVLDPANPIYTIIDSGSRGSWSQPTQMMGMKGLVQDPRGEIIELPVKSSYKEGLTVLEYFISTHGARKGSTDTALKTASAGYLTRRLVDVGQDLVIQEENCGSKDGVTIVRKEGDEFGFAFGDRLYARTALEDIRVARKLIARADEVITREAATAIQASDIPEVKVRSPITCKTPLGICATCYGYDLSKNKTVEIGEAVGIVAAQSIGEPGTQLTMRTFHIGGVAGVDITHGLPRVEEIFEARPPKGKVPLAKAEGVVEAIEEKGLLRVIKVKPTVAKTTKKGKRAKSPHDEYLVPANVTLFVKTGDTVAKGMALCEGPLDLREILAYRGFETLVHYVVNEIQRIYVPEGAYINDKHIELIVRQMLSRVVVKDAGETDLMPGDVVERSEFVRMNHEAKRAKKQPAKAILKVMGITRVALDSLSFLSAASFQETSRVLVGAAIEGKRDPLRGLKENVIIGKLIPAGTGKRGVPQEYLAELKKKVYTAPPIRSADEAPSLVAPEAGTTPPAAEGDKIDPPPAV
jgi:DNA-directed RNA polymerase subunit beta'